MRDSPPIDGNPGDILLQSPPRSSLPTGRNPPHEARESPLPAEPFPSPESLPSVWPEAEGWNTLPQYPGFSFLSPEALPDEAQSHLEEYPFFPGSFPQYSSLSVRV